MRWVLRLVDDDGVLLYFVTLSGGEPIPPGIHHSLVSAMHERLYLPLLYGLRYTGLDHGAIPPWSGPVIWFGDGIIGLFSMCFYCLICWLLRQGF